VYIALFLKLTLQLVRSSRESTEAHTAQLAAAAAALRTAEEETASHKTAHAKRIAEIETLKLQLASLQSAAAQRERALAAANTALEVCVTCHRLLLFAAISTLDCSQQQNTVYRVSTVQQDTHQKPQ
jgi:hypothetical protein